MTDFSSRLITVGLEGADYKVRVPLPFKPMRRLLQLVPQLAAISPENLDEAAKFCFDLLAPENPGVTLEQIEATFSVQTLYALLDAISEGSGVEKKVTAPEPSSTGEPLTPS